MNARSTAVLTRLGRRGAAGLAAAALAASAWAAAPYFSGPSLLKVAQPASFAGKGFEPNAALTIVITPPQGAAASHGAVAGPDGTLTHVVKPSVAGVHGLAVNDTGGRKLVALKFTVTN